MKRIVLNTLMFFLFIGPAKIAIATGSLPKLNRAQAPNWIKEAPLKFVKPSDREISEGYYISYYDYEVAVEKQAAYTKIIKNIVSENGVQNSGEIYIGFDPAYQQVILHRVNIRRNNQILDRLNLNAFKVMADEQDLARFLYKGSYMAYLILEDLRVGDQVEYAYTIVGRNPIFGERYAEDYYLQSSAPLGQVQVRVLADKARKLHFKYFNGAPNPVTQQIGDLISYEWQATAVPAIAYEDYQPSWYDNFRHIQCTEWESWEEVGHWASQVNPVKTELSGPLADKVQNLLQESKGDLYRFLELANRFVQDDIRYMGVEVGEYSHRSNAPENVFRQRYGDCKDKSLLLASMLEYGGIDANLVLISTSYGKSLANYLPSPHLFNHMIVYVEIDQRGQYIDPTFSGQGGPIKDIYVPAYGTCLLLHDDKASLKEVGKGIGGKITIEETYQIIEEDSTAAILTVNTRYTGYQADANRSSFKDIGYAQLEKSYRDYYGKLYPAIEQEDSLIIQDDRKANELVVIEKYFINGFLTINEDIKKYQASFFANMISSQLPTVSGNRKIPVVTGYPLDMSYTVKIISPVGWNVKEERAFIDRKDYLFGFKALAVTDTLVLDYQFAYHSPFIDVKEVPQFASDVRELGDKFLSYSFYISPTSTISGISFFAVFFGIMITVLMIYFCFKQYRSRIVQNQNDHFVYEKIGGWLTLLAISLFFTFFGQLASLFTNRYFYSDVWMAMNIKGAETAMQYKLLLAFEYGVTIAVSVLAAFAFYMMMKRRDVFPKVAIMLYGMLLIFNVVELCGFFIFDFLDVHDTRLLGATIRNVIVSAIWFWYIWKSERVKETFVVPYRSNNKQVEEQALNMT